MKITLNHIYLVLFDKTYRAVTSSDFLRTAFPGFERRTTLTAAGETWFGAYYYGLDNYLEFFSDWAGHWQPQAAQGWGGLALSCDEPGGVEQVARLIQENLGYTPFRTLRKLQDGTNWFHYVSLTGKLEKKNFDAWVMEYHPEIFTQRGLVIGEGGKLTNESYLSKWNQPRKQETGMIPRQPVFRRLISIDLCLSQSDSQKLADVLCLLGYTKTTREEDTILSDGSSSICLLSQPGPGCYTIRSVKLELSRPSVAPATFVFAPGSRLTLGEDATAEWTFGFPCP